MNMPVPPPYVTQHFISFAAPNHSLLLQHLLVPTSVPSLNLSAQSYFSSAARTVPFFILHHLGVIFFSSASLAVSFSIARPDRAIFFATVATGSSIFFSTAAPGYSIFFSSEASGRSIFFLHYSTCSFHLVFHCSTRSSHFLSSATPGRSIFFHCSTCMGRSNFFSIVQQHLAVPSSFLLYST